MVHGEQFVVCLFALTDFQSLFEVEHTIFGAAQHARYVSADFDMIFRLRLIVEHIVERHNAADFCRLHSEDLGQLYLSVHTTIAVFALNDIERR